MRLKQVREGVCNTGHGEYQSYLWDEEVQIHPPAKTPMIFLLYNLSPKDQLHA